jgi:exonuclease III
VTRFVAAVSVTLAIVAAAATVLSSSGGESSAGRAAGRGKVTPPGTILMVTNNLEEGFNPADLRNMREVRVLVGRLLDRLPYEPDILLLQEVRTKSAEYVARVLRKRTSHAYRVAARPGRRPYRQTPSKVIKSDTAIVYNAKTMKKRDAGFVKTSWPARHGDAKEQALKRKHIKRNAYAHLRERHGKATAAVASIHWPGTMRSQKHVNRYGRKWSARIAEFLQRKYPFNATKLHAIGGDFNRESHRDTASGEKAPYPFWRTLTSDHGYNDAVWTVDARPENKDITNGGVDYIFARARILRAGIDHTYDKRAVPPSKYYSNHRFRWTVVKPRGT